MTRPHEKWWEEHAGSGFLRQPEQLNHPIRRRIMAEAKRVGRSVLDVGCATCIDYPIAKSMGLRYAGVDVTEKFIVMAEERHPEVDARHGDVLALPFPERSYDAVYCKDLLEHLPPGAYRDAIKEMWRVADKLMMIGFFIPPTDKPTVYDLTSSGFYQNHYNKGEVRELLRGLRSSDLKIVPDLGENRSSLYVVRK